MLNWLRLLFLSCSPTSGVTRPLSLLVRPLSIHLSCEATALIEFRYRRLLRRHRRPRGRSVRHPERRSCKSTPNTDICYHAHLTFSVALALLRPCHCRRPLLRRPLLLLLPTQTPSRPPLQPSPPRARLRRRRPVHPCNDSDPHRHRLHHHPRLFRPSRHRHAMLRLRYARSLRHLGDIRPFKAAPYTNPYLHS